MPSKKGAKKQGKQPNLLLQQKQERLELLFQELDGSYERHKEDTLDSLKSFRAQRATFYDCIEKALPEWLRNMPMKEVLAKNLLTADLLANTPKEGSQIDLAPTTGISKKVDNSAILSKFITKQKLQQVKQTAPPPKKKLSTIKRKSILAKKVRSSQSRHSRVLPSQVPSTKKAAASDGNESYVDVSEDEVFITPKYQSAFSTVITPKVDPRRTILRSQMRKPKPGELGFSLSGSPLLLEDEKVKPSSRSHSDSMSVKCGTKTYHFSDSSLRGCVTLKERRMIVELQKKLNLMMKK